MWKFDIKSEIYERTRKMEVLRSFTMKQIFFALW